MKNFISILLLLTTASSFSSCDFLFGKKQDDTVDEIFEQGAIDPNLVQEEVGFVPLLPFWDFFSNPVDVYIGYDEMVYVIDDKGLNILDQKGTLRATIAIPGATDVVQDRRLHTYVAGRITYPDLDGDGIGENLAAVYHLTGTATGSYQFVDTLIHPFADKSRNNSSFRGLADTDVEFTGLATLADNTLYVSRRGPTNNPSSIARPDNAVLFFDPEGINIGYANGLNPTNSNLKSALGISSIASFAAPPQRVTGISTSMDFLITQTAPAATYKVLWIKRVDDPEVGVSYEENPELVNFDKSKADRFLYEPDRFNYPVDIFVANDDQAYIFIADSGLDSVYQFTQKGYEGVNPPATSSKTKQVIASFGGTGSGPFQFIDPSGVCFVRSILYVADRGNNRIARYKLSTDLE